MSFTINLMVYHSGMAVKKILIVTYTFVLLEGRKQKYSPVKTEF
jgi:hypothetical protein